MSEIFNLKKLFEKIRIKKKKPVSSAIVRLINEWNALSKPSEGLESKDEIEKLYEQIADAEAEENIKIIIDHWQFQTG